MNTKINTKPFKIQIDKGAFAVAKRAALMIERQAKINMDPLYTSNYRWSKIHPDLLSEKRTGLARASIHTWWEQGQYNIKVGSTSNVMASGGGGVRGKLLSTTNDVGKINSGIAGSSVNYFPYLEFGTWAIPPLGMLRSAFDEVKRGFR